MKSGNRAVPASQEFLTIPVIYTSHKAEAVSVQYDKSLCVVSCRNPHYLTIKYFLIRRKTPTATRLDWQPQAM